MIITTREIAECLGMSVRAINQRSEAFAVPHGNMIGHSKIYNLNEAVMLCKTEAERNRIWKKWGKAK
jgi:NADH pyrophosphatase NudC (nudix superfamily)